MVRTACEAWQARVQRRRRRRCKRCHVDACRAASRALCSHKQAAGGGIALWHRKGRGERRRTEGVACKCEDFRQWRPVQRVQAESLGVGEEEESSRQPQRSMARSCERTRAHTIVRVCGGRGGVVEGVGERVGRGRSGARGRG
eukprot:scaffold148397_cov36-Tisochrysis_lutea.AAC.2